MKSIIAFTVQCKALISSWNKIFDVRACRYIEVNPVANIEKESQTQIVCGLNQ